MSEEFNKEVNRENAADETVHTETSESVQKQMPSGSQPGKGTTYSWVNPKIQQSASNSSSEGTTPWGNGSANSWQTNTRNYGSQSQGQQAQGSQEQRAQRQGGQQAQSQQYWQAQSQVNGPAAGQNEQRYQYSTYQAGQGPAPGPVGRKAKKVKAKKPKKPMSTGKKWMVNVAMALAFGLIAGTVFYGVNIAGDEITGRSNAIENTSAPTTIANTDTSDSSMATPTSTNANSGTVSTVAANAMPSLVTISTMSVEEMQNFFGGTQSYQVEGAGTGVIVGQNETELLIATNNHVVNGATSLSVGFIDETSVEAQIKGTDANNDLAVVAVKLADIPEETMNQIKVATLGNSDDLALGEQVVAIGNALGYGQSVTSGYVSALNRDLTLSDGAGGTFTSTGLIQTDAAINSGNSGGALLNMKGELVGINEAKSSMTSSGTTVDGVGFAIPISKAEPILEELMSLTTREKVSEDQAAYLGVTCVDVTSETSQMYNVPTGVCFKTVVEGGPADQAGVKKGDVLTKMDGREISNYASLKEVLQYYAAGEEVEIIVQRASDGEYQEKTLSVTLGSADDMPQQNESGGSGNGQLFPNGGN